jgi:RHS repeat-associated protein
MKTILRKLATAIGLSLLAFCHAQAAATVTFYHHDALGSVIATSNQYGDLELNEEYQPYGEKIYQTEDFGGDNDDWYTGKNYTKELDLTYFGARWYDAKQGRFLSMDPAPVVLDHLHSFNRYVYSNNNPYSFIDPDGENAVTAIGGLILETGNFLTGGGFDGTQILGALSDGYNGAGEGFAASAYQDATELIPVGKIVGFASKAFKGVRSISVTKAAGQRPIIVGENMKRVREYADKTGGHAYRPLKNDPFDFNLGMKRNERWIKEQMRNGREVIDIGPDFQRRAATGRSSPFYEMERRRLKGYDNYDKAFERNGSNGGVPGLDF